MTTPTPSLEATDRIGAAGAKHPRITLDYMKSQIASAHYIDGETLANSANYTDWTDKSRPFPPNLAVLTVCMVRLKSGFILLGKSAPMSPDNFDLAKGRTFAFEDALRQAWPLFAFHEMQARSDSKHGHNQDVG